MAGRRPVTFRELVGDDFHASFPERRIHSIADLAGLDVQARLTPTPTQSSECPNPLRSTKRPERAGTAQEQHPFFADLLSREELMKLVQRAAEVLCEPQTHFPASGGTPREPVDQLGFSMCAAGAAATSRAAGFIGLSGGGGSTSQAMPAKRPRVQHLGGAAAAAARPHHEQAQHGPVGPRVERLDLPGGVLDDAVLSGRVDAIVQQLVKQ